MTATTLPDLDLLVHDGGAPVPEHLGPDPREERLADLYSYPDPATLGARTAPRVGGAVVRANMVASVDGGAWGPDHLSRSINNKADWRVFRVLRALADVVLVGAGTARAEGYGQLSVPKGLDYLRQAPLELALVTRSGRVPDLLATAPRPPFIITGGLGAPTARSLVPAERVIVVGQENEGQGEAGAEAPDGASLADEVDLAAGVAALAERGLSRVLCEGGPTLLAAMMAANLVDELCLTTSPVLVGPVPGRIVADFGVTRASAPAVPDASSTAPRPATNATLGHLLHGQGTMLTRWLLP